MGEIPVIQRILFGAKERGVLNPWETGDEQVSEADQKYEGRDRDRVRPDCRSHCRCRYCCDAERRQQAEHDLQ